MLYNVLLKENEQYTEIAKQGRHINIVAGAGTLKMRVKYADGGSFQTKAVSGMALELKPFETVAFSGVIAQQLKVWISDLPLTYSSDTTREVGSSAIQSFSAEVYSGAPRILLEQALGRNKVTISPSVDLLIGGTNLNIVNGIPIAAGSKFEFNTQGAIYAFETSGAYNPEQSVKITPVAGEIVAAENNITGLDAATVAFYHANSNEIHSNGTNAINASRSTFTRFNADTLEVLGTYTIDGGSRILTKDFYVFGDLAIVFYDSIMLVYSLINYAIIRSVDLKTIGTLTTANLNDVEYYNGTIAIQMFLYVSPAATQQLEMLYTDDYGENWTAQVLPTDNGASPTDTISAGAPSAWNSFSIAFDGAKHLYVCSKQGLWKSTDNGATVTKVSSAELGGFSFSGGIQIDKTNNIFYANENVSNSNVILRSLDGVTFDNWAIMAGGTPIIKVVGDALLALNRQRALYHRPADGNGAFTFGTEFAPAGVFALGNGTLLYTQEFGGVTLYPEGETITVGGAPVAVMAEVN